MNFKIKQVTENERKAKDETAKQQHEDNLEIAEKKKIVEELIEDIQAKSIIASKQMESAA